MIRLDVAVCFSVQYSAVIAGSLSPGLSPPLSWQIKRACPFPGQPSACKDNIVSWLLASCRCLKIKVKTVAVNLVYHSVFVGLQSLGKLARVV